MEQEEKKEVSVLFFALFETTNQRRDKMMHNKMETFNTEKTADDLFDWVEEERKKISQEFNSNCLLLNCKIIR